MGIKDCKCVMGIFHRDVKKGYKIIQNTLNSCLFRFMLNVIAASLIFPEIQNI